MDGNYGHQISKKIKKGINKILFNFNFQAKRVFEKEGIKSYQKAAVVELLKHCDLKGKKLLEVGGNNCNLANFFIEEGASDVTIINKSNFSEVYNSSENIHFVEGDATRLKDYFSENYFDVIFGVAVLEHMKADPIMLKQMHSVLKKGGTVYLAGRPIWTSRVGHHVWEDFEDRQYHFNDISNPILDWYHLIMDSQEMINFLVEEKSIPQDHAIKIADYVYQGGSLNRICYSKLVNVFRNSDFRILQEYARTGKTPDAETMEKLLSTEYSSEQENFTVEGVAFAMTKV